MLTLRGGGGGASEVGVDVDVLGLLLLLLGGEGGGRRVEEAGRLRVHGGRAVGQVRGDEGLGRGPLGALLVERPPGLVLRRVALRLHPGLGLRRTGDKRAIFISLFTHLFM